MKRFSFAFSCFLIVLLNSSCQFLNQFNFYNIYLSVKDLNGLKEGAVILSKGNQVGNVESVTVSNGENIVVLSINDDFLIPRNSEIRVVSDIENTSAYLEVLMSHSKGNYTKGDTIHSQGTILLNNDIQLEEVKLNIDSLPEGIKTLLQ